VVGGIIITHGPLAQALIQAAEEILGKSDHITGFSITNLSMVDMINRISNIISTDSWPDETLILVCLKGGSCWNAALTTKKKYDKKIAVISGVNLNMLLSFLTKRDSAKLTDLTTLVMQDGVKGIDKN
jgi:mannose PTS system EIIA component